MAHLVEHEIQVGLSLIKGDDSLNDRKINFKHAGGSLQVGRASKTEKKQLTPAEDNLWITNPVISRNHAILYGGGIPPAVHIEDTESSHGTFVNNSNIKGKGKTELKTGDEIQFGDHVMRGTESFQPPVFRITLTNIDKSPPLPQRPSVGRSISVPDDSDDDSEMDESDSDERSIDSRSSPPHWGEKLTTLPGSSPTNPFTIDEDDVPLDPRTIIVDDSDDDESEDEEEVPIKKAVFRDTSEEYSPEPRSRLPYFDEQEYPDLVDEDEVEEEEEEEDEDEEDEDEEVFAPEPVRADSPVYAPPSPTRNAMPMGNVDESMLPFDIFSPAPPAVGSFASTSYSQGPFAQPTGYMSIDPLAEFDFRADNVFPPAASASYAPTYAGPSVTASTQDFLVADSLAERARKNHMSIKSIINPAPASTAGAKRKADEMSEDDEEEFEPQVEVEVLQPTKVEAVVEQADAATWGAERAVTEDVEVEAVAETPEVVVVQTKKVEVVEPPAKKRRMIGSSIASHLATTALGGVLTLAGLAILPDNFFG